MDGVSRNNIARLNPDGTLDTTFTGAVSASGGPSYSFVWGVSLQNDGKYLLCGGFNSLDGISRNCIARMNPSLGPRLIGPSKSGNTFSTLIQTVNGATY